MTKAEEALVLASKALQAISERRVFHTWIEEPARKGGCPIKHAHGEYTPEALLAQATLALIKEALQ